MTNKINIEDMPAEFAKFLQKMNFWEVDFFERRKELVSQGVENSELNREYTKKLENILDEYAIKDKSNYGRLIDLGCVRPATYDPESDKFEVVSKNTDEIVVQVQQVKGAETCSRIYLVRKGEDWKIKKKEILTYDDKWRRASL
ncbi:NTF2 fold immunity protein [Pseudomonas sp. NPDC089743]|uniref:NTF2 fold immunity protein n=1 Tax=Pseudomonas sp. NPDC089743 TaxID=3364471 RepID=UPI00382AF51A